MKKKAHSESEMVRAVKSLESGVSAELVSREFGITRKFTVCTSQCIMKKEGH